MEYINYMEPNYGEEEIQAVDEYMRSGGWLTEFRKTKEFQEKIAEYLCIKNCSVMANGTVTLIAALMACGVSSGDEVIVPDFTMAATAHAVAILGAKPIFADIEHDSFCIDFDSIKNRISARTKAVIIVDLNGRYSTRIKSIVKFCKETGIFLIEDAAQALGSTYKGKPLGTIGDIGSFSFSMPKIITTGQGGALVTNNDELFRKILQIRDFGREKAGADHYMTVGCNFKFTDLQAVIGLEQLQKLESRVKRKKEIGYLYQEHLEGITGVEYVSNNDDVTPCFYEILCEARVQLGSYLMNRGVGTRVFYPALHAEPAYGHSNLYFPISEDISKRGLWLPSSSRLTDEQIIKICAYIRAFYMK